MENMKFIKLIAVLVFLTLSACASGGMGTMDGIMDSWRGANIDDVVKQWGYPHEERSFNGRKLFVWNRSVQMMMPINTSTVGTLNKIGGTSLLQSNTVTYGGGLTNWSCVRIIEVDLQNNVVGGQWEGNNCPIAEMGPYANWRRKM
jgi:hypothetical protein